MNVKMVDISSKPEVFREATAEGFIRLKKETVELIKKGMVEKGDVLSVSSTAALLAVKKTPEILPLTHNIPITYVFTDYEILDEGVKARVTVRTTAKTGVEMEALVGVSIALLNIWDMVKKYEKDERGQYPTTKIEYIKVLEKVKSQT
ncbi:MAG: cyclic pyranopterin monophosphate synthase MoaC [Zestosphaera tikiterensis]|uniref:Probable cyclic pyranopterin monophosphate synthase n=1 Tax=Zestosphaera tikiterensis TaxID=1973259 RepID=A0A2R7Y8W0_9CREN|nr:MAG: cyclic pyranopterin monophosphate synthase MoaC [Zestosphaera tikiterensis]